MDIIDLIKLLKRYWWLLVVSLLLSICSSIFFNYNKQTLYRAHTTLVIYPGDDIKDIDSILRSLSTVDRRSVISTSAKIVSSQSVRESTMSSLNMTPDEFDLYSIGVSIVPDSNIIRIYVSGPDPDKTSIIANSYAKSAKYYFKKYYKIISLEVLDRAPQPSSPVDKRFSRNVGVSIIIGLLLAICFVFLIEIFRKPQKESS